MTTLEIIVYLPILVYAMKGGNLIQIKNINIGSFGNKKSNSKNDKT